MNKDEALKLALESLEWHNQHMHRKISEQAITAIKEALAQPEQDWIERERAVGYREGHQNALKQMAQPEQEPVAVWELFEDGWDSIADQEWMETLPVGTKLYTFTPPQRKPLTDEEIECIYDRYGGNMTNCARAIERAHGIKDES